MNDLWEDAATLLESAADEVLMHGLWQGGSLEDPNGPSKCTIGYLTSQSIALFGMVSFYPTRPWLNPTQPEVQSTIEHEREIYFAAVSAMKVLVPGGMIPAWSDNIATWDVVRDTMLEAAKDIRSGKPNPERDEIFRNRPQSHLTTWPLEKFMSQPYTVTEIDPK